MKSSKVYLLPQLVDLCSKLRREGLRIVFTNGCFDLLHPGHVRYLSQARDLGDLLIVAINSDRAVRNLKGNGRPILTQDERAEVLSALQMVDYVTIFDDISPLATIKALQPNVLVKGGDWDLSKIIGREEVEANGGIVCSLPFVPGISTSEIVMRIMGLTPRN